jgi:hypothetical protein
MVLCPGCLTIFAVPGHDQARMVRKDLEETRIDLLSFFTYTSSGIPPGSMKFTRDFNNHSGCVRDRLYRLSALEICQHSCQRCAGSNAKLFMIFTRRWNNRQTSMLWGISMGNWAIERLKYGNEGAVCRR